jgi:hypothetical protein
VARPEFSDVYQTWNVAVLHLKKQPNNIWLGWELTIKLIKKLTETPDLLNYKIIWLICIRLFIYHTLMIT